MKDAEAVALLQAPFPGLTLHVRRRLLAEADGNALALLELPIALELRRAPSAVLPSVLPLTERLERVFTARLETLPRTPARPLLRATARAREAPRADANMRFAPSASWPASGRLTGVMHHGAMFGRGATQADADRTWAAYTVPLARWRQSEDAG